MDRKHRLRALRARIEVRLASSALDVHATVLPCQRFLLNRHASGKHWQRQSRCAACRKKSLPLQRLLCAQHDTAVHQVGQVELAERPYGSLNNLACMQGAMPDHDQEKKANNYWMRELIRLRDSIGISSRGPNTGNPGQRHCQPQVPLLLMILSSMSYLTQSVRHLVKHGLLRPGLTRQWPLC